MFVEYVENLVTYQAAQRRAFMFCCCAFFFLYF